jgi:hypothetical protein
MIEIELRPLQSALLDFHRCFGLVERSLRLVQLGQRGIFFCEQLLSAPLGRLRVLERGARISQITFGLRDSCLEDRRVDLRYHLALLHRRIEVHEKLLNVAGNLTANLHIDDRVERAGRGHRLRDCATHDSHGLVFTRAAATAPAKTENREQRNGDKSGDEDDSLHEGSRRDCGDLY